MADGPLGSVFIYIMAKAAVFRAVLFFALVFVHQGAIIESKSKSSITNSAAKQDQPKNSGSSVSHAGKQPRKSRVKPLCARTLPKKYINDDFCDCLVDGSDEPGRQIKLDYLCLSFCYGSGFLSGVSLSFPLLFTNQSIAAS